MRTLVLAGLLLAASVLPGCSLLDGGVGPKDYLRGDYSVWVIEIDHAEGHAPTSIATSALKDRMEELARKDTIEIRTSAVSAGRSTWSVGQIEALSRDTKDADTGGDTVVTHVLYLGGRFEEEGVLGIAIGHDLIAIFPEAIAAGCTPLRGCAFNEASIERAVLVHEFGHAIGLVDRGVGMVNDHEDDAHPKHSDNPNSVMYWAVETAGGIAGIDRIPTTFDTNDKLDVCRAGGEGRC